MINRRQWIQVAGGAVALGVLGASRAQTGGLKISHQFPSGSLTDGDFRDQLCRRFAAEVEKRTKGALKSSVYPGSSLMKTNAQFSALRKGALDMSLVPLSYAGGEVAETNIGLMPALVPSYEQGAAWKTADVGKQLAAFETFQAHATGADAPGWRRTRRRRRWTLPITTRGSRIWLGP